MLYTVNTKTDLKIETPKDLAKLQPFGEHNKLKINATQIARELGVDRRTVIFQNLKNLLLEIKLLI